MGKVLPLRFVKNRCWKEKNKFLNEKFETETCAIPFFEFSVYNQKICMFQGESIKTIKKFEVYQHNCL